MKLLIMLKNADHIEHGVTADRDVFGALVLMVRLLARQSAREFLAAHAKKAQGAAPQQLNGVNPDRSRTST